MALPQTPQDQTTTAGTLTATQVARIALVAVELLLVLLVIREFRLVNPAAADILKLAAVGFVVHAITPLRFRLPLFVGLSLAGILMVLGLAGGAQLILLGLVLIGICHVPVAWGVRIAALLVAGGVLAAGRAALLPLPVGQAVWPILGGLFMFRLIIYVYDLRHDRALASWSGGLAYFFLLPNVAFPFFPVVDYKTFRRTYYDADAGLIYQRGVAWMLRGAVQLILYRFVYYYFTLAPEDIQTASQLVRYVVANYGLYLRVSGTFHLIVGVLLLFGFHLPVTNNFYFLASGFTDYWRRINIYWKDFMMKCFYYPSFFQLRRLGNTNALILATVVVFIATTVLHSYQWFWLRGDWYLSPQDAAFWTILGAMVIVNVVWESKKGRKRSLGTKAWSLKDAALRGVRVLLTFVVLSSLWSLWSAPSIEEWIGMWSVWNVGAPVSAGVAKTLGAALAVAIAGGLWITRTASGGAFGKAVARAWPAWRESPAVVLVVALALLVAGSPGMRARFTSTPLLVLEDLQHDRLNRRDQETLERGYYENLFGVESTNPELATLYSKVSNEWVSLWQTDAVVETGDLRRLAIRPDVDMIYKGQPLTTNAWGMRDRARTLAPAPGTFRFAILGASTTMGSGVRDDETFPALVERHLNADSTLPPVEVLNFAVESYNAIEQVVVADDVIPPFAPHGLIYVAHETEFEKTMAGLADFVEARTDLRYGPLRAIVDSTGIEPGMRNTIALRALGRYRDRVLGWAYRHIATEARARGILPIWAFIPMPVAGTGPCPPGGAELFCFGNTSRVGAAADASDPRVRRLMELARDAGFVVLDLSDVYGMTDLTSLWISAADGHPNADGHRMIAEGLTAALRGDSTVTGAVTARAARSQ